MVWKRTFVQAFQFLPDHIPFHACRHSKQAAHPWRATSFASALGDRAERVTSFQTQSKLLQRLSKKRTSRSWDLGQVSTVNPATAARSTAMADKLHHASPSSCISHATASLPFLQGDWYNLVPVSSLLWRHWRGIVCHRACRALDSIWWPLPWPLHCTDTSCNFRKGRNSK